VHRPRGIALYDNVRRRVPLPRLVEMPLQRAIGLLVLAGLLLLIGLFGLLGMVLAQDSAQRLIAEQVVAGRLVASFLDDELGEQFERLEQAATLAASPTADPADRPRLLAELWKQSRPFVAGVFLVDQAGHLVWSEPADLAAIGVDPADHPYVDRPLAPGARYASGVHAVGTGGRPRIVLAVPVAGADGTRRGVLGAAVDPTHPTLSALLMAARQFGQPGYAELVDQNMRVIASSDPEHVLEISDYDDLYGPLLERRTSGVGTITHPTGDPASGSPGERRVMAFVPLTTVPWGLGLGTAEAELTRYADRWRVQTVMLSGLSLAIALFVGWVGMRGVVLPVRTLTAASRRLGAGDLATPVPRLGGGEVRTLAEAFDQMRQHLQQTLDALAVEKSRHQAIVGSMADAVVTTDAQLRITAINPAAEALTGWPAEEALGRPCYEVVQSVDEDGEEICRSICARLATASATFPAAAKETLRRHDGQTLVVAIMRSAIRNQSGAPVGVVHVLRDVSAEEELSRAKDEFLATVSHELQTPVGLVHSYATTLLLPEGMRDEEIARRCLRVIIEASDELRGLVDNLLDMAKINGTGLAVEPQAVRLGPLARAAVKRVRVRAGSHRLRVAVPASLPPVSADPHRIEQVLYNLLDNAIKYSPGGGRVTVAGELAGAVVKVSVADEGIGIPPEELGQVFARFYRGRSARDRHIAGSGLGLAICSRIVEAHGGRIWAESPVPGRPVGAAPGSVVRFTLPVAIGPVQPGSRAGRRSAAGTRPRPSGAAPA
jgi:PAS domain S-box-containing protein